MTLEQLPSEAERLEEQEIERILASFSTGAILKAGRRVNQLNHPDMVRRIEE